MFSIGNILIVALMQVGVIVAGVLASGLCHKIRTNSGIAMPHAAALLYDYGVLSFSIPIVWTTIALIVLRRPQMADEVKSAAFWLGVLLLLLLLGFVWHADVSPWFHGEYGMVGD